MVDHLVNGNILRIACLYKLPVAHDRHTVIGLVPEERRKQGMFPVLSICENIMMLNYEKVKSAGKINFSKAKEIADHHIEALVVSTLSFLIQCNLKQVLSRHVLIRDEDSF